MQTHHPVPGDPAPVNNRFGAGAIPIEGDCGSRRATAFGMELTCPHPAGLEPDNIPRLEKLVVHRAESLPGSVRSRALIAITSPGGIHIICGRPQRGRDRQHSGKAANQFTAGRIEDLLWLFNVIARFSGRLTCGFRQRPGQPYLRTAPAAPPRTQVMGTLAALASLGRTLDCPQPAPAR